MKIWTSLNKIAKDFKMYLLQLAKKAAKGICFAWHNVMQLLRRLGAAIIVHKEEMGYYAVLTLVLVALGAAANDYRSKRTMQSLISALPTQEPGISVQSKPDQTLPPESTKPKYILPVQGTVVGAFSDSELNWSTTLQLWQTHPAVDIAASAGEAVIAAADGTVAEAYSDALYGNVIVIDHGDDSVLRYSSLNTLKLVQVGQRVKQGEVISAVGTCDAEADLGAHVHLEYFMNQKPEDFLLLLEDAESDGLQN